MPPSPRVSTNLTEMAAPTRQNFFSSSLRARPQTDSLSTGCRVSSQNFQTLLKKWERSRFKKSRGAPFRRPEGGRLPTPDGWRLASDVPSRRDGQGDAKAVGF